MEENEFFRQTTLRICGNLEIEEALKSSLQYLQRVIPLDRIFLQYYDQSFGAMRTIASATPKECSKMDLLTPLSEEAQQSAGFKNLPAHNNIFVFDNPQEYAISREMLSFHRVPGTSVMVMLLKSKEQMLGSLVIITEGNEKYSAEHTRLLSLLKDPFVIALSNTLKHREVLKLKDLLADDNRYLHGELRRLSGDEIVGANFGLRDVMYKVQASAKM
jgi:transcriptional regulator with GAF, ATPase, and Fis domain